jgi:choline dehydrogenase-like flavoprotein
MNPQSHGQITLNSANPKDKPVIDANLCAHPYDKRVLIEGMRKLLEMLQAPVFKETTVEMVGVPKSGSDEDIWVSFNYFCLFQIPEYTLMTCKAR